MFGRGCWKAKGIVLSGRNSWIWRGLVFLSWVMGGEWVMEMSLC